MKMIHAILIISSLLHFGFPPEQDLIVNRLTVAIEPLEYKKGTIHMAIYDGEDTFPDAPEPYRKQKVKVLPGGRMDIHIDELPPGQYAIAIYLDENDNNELDKNVFGIPKEPYGFSNNPRAKWSAPRFDEVVFEMNTAGTKLAIDLKKWKHR